MDIASTMHKRVKVSPVTAVFHTTFQNPGYRAIGLGRHHLVQLAILVILTAKFTRKEVLFTSCTGSLNYTTR